MARFVITAFYKDVANAGKFYKTKWGMSEKTHATMVAADSRGDGRVVVTKAKASHGISYQACGAFGSRIS